MNKPAVELQALFNVGYLTNLEHNMWAWYVNTSQKPFNFWTSGTGTCKMSGNKTGKK
jgi:hypothetical protein